LKADEVIAVFMKVVMFVFDHGPRCMM